MSEAKTELTKPTNTYCLSEYIRRLEARSTRMEKKIAQLNFESVQFEIAMQAMKHMKLAKPLQYLKAGLVDLQKQVAKYQGIEKRRKADIKTLMDLGKTEMRLYCVTQVSGRQSYVKADHIKLAEMVCSCLADPAYRVVALSS
jgi:uncharacterized coiled-coil protein SlyX